MKTSTLAILASASTVSAGLIKDCNTASSIGIEEGGNWFCGLVNHIQYEGIRGKGTYKAVTGMNSQGNCQTEDRPYSGPLAPLDEDISLHFRGPLELAEVAVYNIGGKQKRDEEQQPVADNVHHARHAHGHNHAHLHKKKSEDVWVTATIDGQVVSWINDWNPNGPAKTEPTAAPAPAAPKEDKKLLDINVNAKVKSFSENENKSYKSKPKSKPKSQSSGKGGAWSRVAHYDADAGKADNIVFLGNYGGAGSGVFDNVWGNSLSFLNAKGDNGCSKPEVLKPGVIPSNKEFSIWSAEKCDESCGFARAKDVAYKGFAGTQKVFLAKLRMPMDGNREFNGDMPAMWMLNGAISRTGQYNDCSCWTTGCGEADILEVLASGDTKCKSTLHLNNSGGSSDYFQRPTEKFMNVATIFDEETASISIRELPADFNFGESLSAEQVKDWINRPAKKDNKFSLFQLSA